MHMNKLIKDTFRNAWLAWASLILAYNTFKEYVRGPEDNAFPLELKVAIKATFPWALLIFMFLFLMLGILSSRKSIYPTFKQYSLLIVLYAFLVNIILFSERIGVFVALNLSSIYLLLILLALLLMAKIPPEIKKYYMVRVDVKWNHINWNNVKLNDVFFYSNFLILLMLCTFLNGKMIATALQNVAYLMLVVGVGVKIYEIVKHRERSDGYLDSSGR